MAFLGVKYIYPRLRGLRADGIVGLSPPRAFGDADMFLDGLKDNKVIN
jgi:hypothetical protein